MGEKSAGGELERLRFYVKEGVEVDDASRCLVHERHHQSATAYWSTRTKGPFLHDPGAAEASIFEKGTEVSMGGGGVGGCVGGGGGGWKHFKKKAAHLH